MTREELFSAFPRPWRLSEEDLGVVLAANGEEVCTVDTMNSGRDENVVIACAELIAAMGNVVEE